MQIKIKQKFYLLSHEIGSLFLFLNTSYVVQIFPGKLKFQDLNSKKAFDIDIYFEGPVLDFTINQNLISGYIDVSFHTQKGFLAYKLLTKNGEAFLYLTKAFQKEIEVFFDKKLIIKEKQLLSLPFQAKHLQPQEILSFGVFKKPDIQMIRKRDFLQEILPILFLLAQFYNDKKFLVKKELFKNLLQNIFDKQKELLEQNIIKVIKTHFSKYFIPRIKDEDYQNVDCTLKSIDNPLDLLSNFYFVIKQMFIRYEKNRLYLLPCMLKNFHHGKASFQEPFGFIELYWSKKLLKKAVIRPIQDIKIKMVLQSKIKTFRMRCDKKDLQCKNQDEIFLKKDQLYFLDRFEK